MYEPHSPQPRTVDGAFGGLAQEWPQFWQQPDEQRKPLVEVAPGQPSRFRQRLGDVGGDRTRKRRQNRWDQQGQQQQQGLQQLLDTPPPPPGYPPPSPPYPHMSQPLLPDHIRAAAILPPPSDWQ